MREYKFFRGYLDEKLIQIDWNQTIVNPSWIVDSGLVQYTPPTYIIPNYFTTTGTGVIPLSGTATGFSLTTSNPNGITYTTGGFGGLFTTFTSNIK